MHQTWTIQPLLQQRAMAVAVAGAAAGALAAMFSSSPATAAATGPAASAAPAITPAGTVYSIINLGPDSGGTALLNERGQAAFNSFNYHGGTNGYFDGDRIREIGTLGGSYTEITALNNQGVVVGSSEDGAERSNVLGFTWTAAGGMRALPGTSVASAEAINDLNYIAGLNAEVGISARAVRWNPGGAITPLGPRPTSLSEASAINQLNVATGFADSASGTINATLWDASGKPTNLGTLGGSRAFGFHINARSEVAGRSDITGNTREIGFFWRRLGGMLPIDGGGPLTDVADLNDRTEAVGYTLRSDERLVAYKWTPTSGLTQLPSLSFRDAVASAINNGGDIVGSAQLPVGQGYAASRAVRWGGVTTPIDLNARLYRAPAGLIVHSGHAINDAGVILANSNAGLVMLRPGTRGTDAPVLGPLATLPRSVELGQDLTLTVGFADNSVTQTHKASVVWTDGCPSPAPTVREAAGTGQVTLRHRFCAAGFHAVRLRVTDSGGRSTELLQDVTVEDPAQASLSGAGTLHAGTAATGRTTSAAPLRFSLWAPLDGASQRAGAAGVMLSGPFQFRSEQVTSVSREGPLARVSGTGRFNGRAGYRFILEAQDGGSQNGATDRLRVRITHVDATTDTDVVDYDNAAPAKLRAATPARDLSAVADGSLTLQN
ncbi:UNVERIFIED_ORG: hypothetical protein JN05_04878 [Zoogloea ramigera]|uniref:PKD domain-containing protein n=1 Tax=Duganella zoogloeoides TaxID=75659 RepID=A0ABZ0XSI0_9BURK|nr:hypothetical protein [Duganella zoogloeoides]WQH02186.1 hypothetical protein SR858_13930 [Duganella zoogloeoides]